MGGAAAPAASIEQLREQVQRLSRIVSEQHSAVMDEVQFQRYMIHQVPGRLTQAACREFTTKEPRTMLLLWSCALRAAVQHHLGGKALDFMCLCNTCHSAEHACCA
jgi:hypothetical protein